MVLYIKVILMVLHIKVIMLSKLNFMLLAPTASFLLNHLVQVRGEKEWPLDLSRLKRIFFQCIIVLILFLTILFQDQILSPPPPNIRGHVYPTRSGHPMGQFILDDLLLPNYSGNHKTVK